MIKKILLLGLFVVTCIRFSNAQNVNATLKAGYDFISNAQEPEALAQFLLVLKTDSNNYEATWNASLLYSKIGNRMTDEDKQKKYFMLAKRYALKALEINAADAESNYVMAVAMGRIALISGAHDKVAAARDIKSYAEAALKYNPQHAGAWYVLGLWNYNIANLNFFERAMANMLFGGIPDASVDNAIADYKKAIQLDPTYILYWKDLGVAYDNEDKTADAIKALKTAIGLTARTADDPEYLKEAKDLLKKLQ